MQITISLIKKQATNADQVKIQFDTLFRSRTFDLRIVEPTITRDQNCKYKQIPTFHKINY